jgi:hypothetical protein
MIELFIDASHITYKHFGIKPELFIAQEVALYLYDSNRRLSQHTGVHSLTNLTWQIVQTRWNEKLNDNPQKIRQDILAFLEDLRKELPVLLKEEAENIFEELSVSDQQLLAENLFGQGGDLNSLEGMKVNGEYLKIVHYKLIPELFKKYSEKFFDNKFWSLSFTGSTTFDDDVIGQIRAKTCLMYLTCLEDAVAFIDWQKPDSAICSRARAALTFLKQKMV